MLEIGTVVHNFVSNIQPPNNKYLVCISPKLNLFLLINTENRLMYDCVEILYSKYQFLNDKNRFVSCSRFFELPMDNNIVKGKLDEEDILKLYHKVQQSKRLSPSEKQRFILNVKEYDLMPL